jgi:ABC-type glycerol-3-phosphate transport system substrate-binding protein
MKPVLWKVLALVVVLSMLFTACAPAAEQPAAEQATEGESAPAQGGKTITWATLAGFYTDWAKQLAKDYEEKSGNKVVIVEMDLPTMFEKEVLDMRGGTGTYDIVTWNVSWKSDWANNGFLYPLDDYIKRDNATFKVEDINAALLATGGQWGGKTYGLPYYTFTPGLIYRCDLFENADEMTAFEAKYGYKLDIPQTYNEMADIAEFFRRAPGATLKGEALDKDFYGVGLMAGRYGHIFDEINTIAWTYGGDVVNDDGTPGVNQQVYLDAVHMYVDELLPYAPPGSLSGGYDFVISQFNTGLISMTGPMYLDQWPNAVKVETNIPGSEACMAPLPGGGKTWAGAFSLGITKSSKNPDDAWNFLSYITGPEAQRKFAEGGGSTTRMSILGDKEFYSTRRETAGHFPVLVQILDHASSCWQTNFIYSTAAANIYEESPAWLSAAASKEKNVEDAMTGFAEKITEFCGGGACELYLDGVNQPQGECAPPPFDRSAQLRK